MITEILTLMEGFNTVHDFFGRVTGIFNGSKDENARYLIQINESLKNIDSRLKTVNVERLSDSILYTPLLESVRDITQTQQRIISDLRDVRASLEPVQRALGGEIISSAMIETPNKMQNALSRSPWEVLIDICPAHLAIKPNNPSLVPILFKYQGMYFIGWQLKGMLVPSFDCEFSRVWTPNLSLELEAEEKVHEAELSYIKEQRLEIKREKSEIAKQIRLTHEREQVRLAQERLRREQEELESLKRQQLQDVQNSQSRENSKSYIERIENVHLSMIYVEGGSFMMGSSEKDSEKPIHQVTIKPFYMGKYPVTQVQYQAVMDNNPSNLKGDSRPVERVSWKDSVAFCEKLSKMTGKTYRLPSESEWEYACRAGSATKWCFGDSENLLKDYAWYDGNSGSQTHSVGEKLANAFGLYDMHGNVWEWCLDDWHDNYNGAPTDGSAWIGRNINNNKVLRGGSWVFHSGQSRSAYRHHDLQDNTFINVGFRILRAF